MTLREQLEHRDELRETQQEMKQGIERGIRQGMQKKAEERALKMLETGLPLVQIVHWTGLSVEKIEQLKREKV